MKILFSLLILIHFWGIQLFAEVPFRQGKDYALFFAVDKYKNLDDLKNPIDEAKKLAKKLALEYEFKTEVVENPTRKTVKEKLEFYRDQFKNGNFDPNGQLFIFFTGHGIFEKESNNGFFIPADGDPDDLVFTSIQYSYWRPFINNFNCNGTSL